MWKDVGMCDCALWYVCVGMGNGIDPPLICGRVWEVRYVVARRWGCGCGCLLRERRIRPFLYFVALVLALDRLHIYAGVKLGDGDTLVGI